VTYHIWLKPFVPPKVKPDFRPKNRKSIVSLMPAGQSPQATVPDADVDSAASFLYYLYIISQYTVRLMTPCIWRILYLRNSSSVPYFQQPPNLKTAACRNRKCTECGTTTFGRNRMSAETAHLSTFSAETEIRLTSIINSVVYSDQCFIPGQTIMKNRNLRETKNEIKMCLCSFVADNAHLACPKMK